MLSDLFKVIGSLEAGLGPEIRLDSKSSALSTMPFMPDC